jgi:aryl-alcohol dehydrogenase-like predicted oxidoreductase
MRLALGTVQFGADYGVSNQEGRVSTRTVGEILTAAREEGVDLLDTAHLYGDAEAVLGAALTASAMVRIVTKTPRFDGAGPDGPRRLQDAFSMSLARLGRKAVHGLLFHHAPDLLGEDGDRLWSAASELRERGLVTALGVSVYAPEDASRILERFPVELVQLPLNVLDRRFVETGVLDALVAAGAEVHVRSAFLQGLLLMDPSETPRHFTPIRALLGRYHAARTAAGLSPVEAALGFLRGIPGIQRVVVGVTRPAELRECAAAARRRVNMDYGPYSCQDPDMIEPFRWTLT